MPLRCQKLPTTKRHDINIFFFMTAVSTSLLHLIFVSRCRIEDKCQENSSKAEPNGQYR